MTPPRPIVVPYTEFLERRERRRRAAAELRRQDARRTIDALDVLVAEATPLPGEQTGRLDARPQPAHIGASDSRPHER